MIEPLFNIGDEVETNDLYKKIGESVENLLGGDINRKLYRCGKVTNIQVETINIPLPLTSDKIHVD
jgi:hypothetical protein